MLPAVSPKDTHCTQHQTQPDLYLPEERKLIYFPFAPFNQRAARLIR